jgi:hypothetical protein
VDAIMVGYMVLDTIALGERGDLAEAIRKADQHLTQSRRSSTLTSNWRGIGFSLPWLWSRRLSRTILHIPPSVEGGGGRERAYAVNCDFSI